MAKYIDADELKNAFTNWREIVNNPYDLSPSVEECKAVIDAQPTADVAEVRHGRWVDGKRIGFDGTFHWFRQCSECLYEREDDTPEKDSNYCPNCGALMMDEVEE